MPEIDAYTDMNFHGGKLAEAAIDCGPDFPTQPVRGQLFYNTDPIYDALCIYDGVQWRRCVRQDGDEMSGSLAVQSELIVFSSHPEIGGALRLSAGTSYASTIGQIAVISYLNRLAFVAENDPSYKGFYLDMTEGGSGYSHWSRLWHENNDGADSGLDADLLDGLHASAFFPAIETPESITGTVTDPVLAALLSALAKLGIIVDSTTSGEVE